ncbi:MlaD family protein [Mycobacterium sp. 1274756.6]|uniref:MlaD family protein n=1 Tax=Mycobacterium sp. 1274756.6 TaxID=1834076 RepID=UPI0007FBB80D|nr:MlaD family protein [Mycobacterium sp. 1274756.6]OBJ70556.1 mammalian cell entry protein [Mycobacterium sp. 1274756.6]
MKLLRNPKTWGVAALSVLAAIIVVAAALYVNPPGRTLVTFYTDDAASVRPGDQVRIAGITVGKVQDLILEPDQVRVRASVSNDAFVGEHSQVEVRMLTVVGGYYVNIVSLGDQRLGSLPIPRERVTMPYNLMRTLADATKITDNVDPDPIRQTLDHMQDGLAGENSDSIRAVIDAGNALASTIEAQRGQVSAIINLSDEYIESLKDFKEGLRMLVRKAAILEQTLVLYGGGFSSALKGLGDVFDALAPVGYFYENHRDDFLERVHNWQEKARYWAERDGVIVRGIRLVRNKIERVLDAQNAPPEFLATDICIPVAGRAC